MSSFYDNADDNENKVRQCYSTWGTDYYREYYGPDAPYPPVHLDLIRKTVDRLSCHRLLDAGCGPASMLRHLTAPGRELYGFDLTPEMIFEARRVLHEVGIPSQHVWEGSVLNSADFTPPSEATASYDGIICCGVLPHIPESADIDCIANIRAALRPGGYAIVEARNELFSLFTFNRYSHQFVLNKLVPVRELRAVAGDENTALNQALQDLKDFFRSDTPPLRYGKADEPGYDEVLSRLHNPLVLRDQFLQQGFDDVQILFYHFHCLPPMLQTSVPRISRQVSIAMEAHPEDWRGLVMASAFIVVARRA